LAVRMREEGNAGCLNGNAAKAMQVCRGSLGSASNVWASWAAKQLLAKVCCLSFLPGEVQFACVCITPHHVLLLITQSYARLPRCPAKPCVIAGHKFNALSLVHPVPHLIGYCVPSVGLLQGHPPQVARPRHPKGPSAAAGARPPACGRRRWGAAQVKRRRMAILRRRLMEMGKRGLWRRLGAAAEIGTGLAAAARGQTWRRYICGGGRSAAGDTRRWGHGRRGGCNCGWRAARGGRRTARSWG
jgi:hypothetical protein